MFIEAVISSTSLAWFKVFLIVLHMTLNKQKEFKMSKEQINQTFNTSNS